MDTGPAVTDVDRVNQYKSIKECTMEQGKNAIDTKKVFNMAVSINFVVKDTTKACPLRAEVITLVEVMKKVDPQIVIKQPKSNQKWNNMKNHLTGNDFKNLFAIHTVTNTQNRIN
eukprot:8555452-Ditylum_brightwellii.AAC.1